LLQKIFLSLPRRALLVYLRLVAQEIPVLVHLFLEDRHPLEILI